jgi:amidase/aspartyl-tRNA(Asn)/glutamyl-tRNA(Gln) amidotransferase subunit A
MSANVMNATALAQQVRSGAVSAVAVAQQVLADVAARDGSFNCFTEVTHERALAEAKAVDDAVAAGKAAHLPLAGVPYAVKNLFDLQGITTLAGSVVEKGQPAATQDATLVARLKAAGAVCVGALNMDEYAYGFTTENTHYGPTRNPHDGARISGGSSGGSAAAVAARLVPLTLGSDTNGSIRVPSSLCGVWGLKPTFSRLSRAGTYPFVASFDHLGPFAANVADLAACFDAMQGPDPRDWACAPRAAEPTVPALAALNVKGLRVGILGGFFQKYASEQALASVAKVAQALGATEVVDIPEAQMGRSAAFIITMAEGGQLHLKDLPSRHREFEPLSRDRFIAGTLLPAAWVQQAQRARNVYRERFLKAFDRFDVLLAAATPVPAPVIGTETITLGGETMNARASMGLFTQPISCIGLPVVAAPVVQAAGALPLGVQIIAAPWREDRCLAVAAALEAAGVAACAPFTV